MSARVLEQLSPPVRRVLAAGLLAILVLAFVFWVVLPSLRWATGTIEALADARFELNRATRPLATDLRRQAELVESVHRDLSSHLVAGPKDSDAAGAFQAGVSQTLAAQGLEVETMAARALTTDGPLRQLSLDWRGSATEASLVKALAAVESGRPLMRVERLAVQRRAGVGSAGNTAAEEQLLLVEMRIVAYWAAVVEPTAMQSGPGK